VHLGEYKKKNIHKGGSRLGSDIKEGWVQNVEGTRSLIEISIVCGVKRFIFGSWAGVYVHIPARSYISETMPLLPLNQYFYQKITGEYYLNYLLKLTGLSHLINQTTLNSY
jgi:nucleoside-diphosphate-sugar epimerase